MLFQQNQQEEKQMFLRQVVAEHLDALADENPFQHAFAEKSLTGVKELSNVMTRQDMRRSSEIRSPLK
jgi:hypothetical protein